MNASAPGGGGGAIQLTPCTKGVEASVGYYNYIVSRVNVAGDMWVGGINCWALPGYNLDTGQLSSCFNMNNEGYVTMPYLIRKT